MTERDLDGAIAMLRSQTRASHETVDAAFAGYDLSDRDHYRRFLIGHARALPVAEALAAKAMPLRPRTPLLADDLAALGETMPPPLAFEVEGEAAAWGALYVVEGSRLGGRMLAQAVPDVLPSAYLGAIHLPGGWRDLRTAIDAAAASQDADWHAAMLAGALATFDLYRRAAASA